MKKNNYIIAAAICCMFYACTKPGIEGSALPRLQKIITSGVDSLGNDCKSCLYYQFFTYDANGHLTNITDSNATWRHQYNGPQPYFLVQSVYSGVRSYGSNYSIYVILEYNTTGNFNKAGRDSFIYNNNNQVIERYSRVQCATCPSYLVNRYTYDTKGRLIADSSYTGQTALVPKIVLHEYTALQYDANDNVVQTKSINVLPGTYPVNITNAQYDNQVNPFKGLGQTGYLLYKYPFMLSSNNLLPNGYTCEYHPNGLPKRITYQNYIQEFFYE